MDQWRRSRRANEYQWPVHDLQNLPDAGRQLVAGSDGNIWFGDNDISSTIIGRLTPAGEFAEFNSEGTFASHWLTLGPDNEVWYTAGVPGIKIFSKEGESSAIGRITPSGLVTEFDLKSTAILQQIVTGPDGNLWFVNQAEPNFTIDRISPKGEIKEFAITEHPWLQPSGIAAGVNGNVYFGASGENPMTTEDESVIMEITPAGERKLVKRLNFSEVFDLATGPEGSLWFTGLHTQALQPYVIGRLTPTGFSKNTWRASAPKSRPLRSPRARTGTCGSSHTTKKQMSIRSVPSAPAHRPLPRPRRPSPALIRSVAFSPATEPPGPPGPDSSHPRASTASTATPGYSTGTRSPARAPRRSPSQRLISGIRSPAR